MRVWVVSIWMDGSWGRILKPNLDSIWKVPESQTPSNLTIVNPAEAILGGRKTDGNAKLSVAMFLI